MKTTEIIESAIQMAESIENTELATALGKVEGELKSDTLKVVVLGDFKAGKSTLINALFLKQNLLPVDILESTAVPTHLTNGPVKMQTWLRRENGEETRQDEWTDIDQEKVKSVVTADTEEKRAEIAKKYSRVTISMPDILPEGITIVDTPGLNTPNDNIYIGTMYEARTAHAILYVARSQQLSEREVSLLADLAGMQQPSLPIHVVLTMVEGQYEPGQVEVLRREISAQLAGVGMSHTGVSVFNFGQSQVDEPVDSEDGIGNIYWDVMEPTSISEENLPQQSTNIHNEIVAFLQGAARLGRRIRQIRDMRPLLVKLDAALHANMELSGKDKQEIAQIRQVIDKQQDDYELIVVDVLKELKNTLEDAEGRLVSRLDDLSAAFEMQVQEAKSIESLHRILREWSKSASAKVNDRIKSILEDLRISVASIGNKYRKQFGRMAGTVQVDDFDPGALLRPLLKIPNEFITGIIELINYVLDGIIFLITSRFSKFASVCAILLRRLSEETGIGKGVFGRDVTIATITLRIAVSIAVSKFSSYIEKAKNTVREHFGAEMDKIYAECEEKFRTGVVFPELNHAMDQASQKTLSADEISRLREQSELVRSWLTAMQ